MNRTLLFFLFFSFSYAYAQVENVPVQDPVYHFLISCETKGILPNFSTSSLPLQRNEIISALKLVRNADSILTNLERNTLDKFEDYFEITPTKRLVVFYSETDSNQVFSDEFFTNKRKYFYYNADSNHHNTIRINPLASIEYHSLITNDENKNVLLGNLGIRLSGTLSNHFGYFLQATNGSIFSGDREVALLVNGLKNNIKFTEYKSDFDFTESHIAFNYDWFYASIGRETRQMGSGINHSMYLSDNAPPYTAIKLAAKFKIFEYQFLTGGLLTYYQDSLHSGFNALFPQKFITTHRFTLKPSWGEIAFWESVVYSNRNMDLEYLNPLSFYKSLEHALRDRDNSIMGMDFTFRPIRNIMLKGTYLLDDIIFSEIGKNFWGNKSALNIGVWYASPLSCDFGLEYARVEPYTFTHFNQLNSYTNDNKPMSTELLPNSEEYSAAIKFWWGQRQPIIIKAAFLRQGENIYDETGNLIKNVGSDIMQTRRQEDNLLAYFLDGHLIETLSLSSFVSYEFLSDFTANFFYSFSKSNGSSPEHIFRFIIKYENF